MIVSEIIPIAGFLVLIFLISGRIIALKRNDINVSSGTRYTGKTKFILYSIFLLILLLFLFETIKPVYPISFSLLPKTCTNLLVDSLLMKIVGILFIAFALVFLSLALLHFKTSLRFGLDEKNKGQLITFGVFSISRNPFFVSLDLYFAGVAIVLPSLFFISFAILALVSIHIFILKEEKFMLKVYGEEYEKYLKNVRRYF